MGVLNDKAGAASDASAFVDLAAAFDQFLVCAVFVDGDGVLKLRRVTWQFPTKRFGEAVKLLADDLKKEIELPPVALQPADMANLLDMIEKRKERTDAPQS